MLEKVEGKKGKDKLPNSNKKVKNSTSISTTIKIKNVLKPKVQKKKSSDIFSSPKNFNISKSSSKKENHVDTLLEKNIVIPQHDFTSLQ